MRVLILGGSGFIGKALTKALLGRGHKVVVSTRQVREGSENLSYGQWDGNSWQGLVPLLQDVQAVVNLLGENIAAERWTEERKVQIVQSRLQAGQALSKACQESDNLPECVIQASAVGYYGCWTDAKQAPLCDESQLSGTGFLAATARQWEDSTLALSELEIRRCIIRTAPVLSASGGMLQKILRPFRYGLGGRVGSGQQPFPWIHLDDEVEAIIFLITNHLQYGEFNLVAPSLNTMKDFTTTLSSILHRPAILPLPGKLLHFLLGQMADELLLAGQRAVPAHLLGAEFKFKYPTLIAALQAERL